MSKHFITSFYAECLQPPAGDYGLRITYQRGDIYLCKLIELRKKQGGLIGKYFYIHKGSASGPGEEIGINAFKTYFSRVNTYQN